MAAFPHWIHLLCSTTLVLGMLCAIVIQIDMLSHPPHMAIMARVWPLCALFGTIFVVWLYFRHGRGDHAAKSKTKPRFPVIVAKGTLHCGAGCTLGDILAEWLAFAVPAVAVACGWHWLFGDETYAVWVLDFFVAFGLGIVFQYFAIMPMRHLPPRKAILAAVKADTLSLVAWQIGMYGFMAYLQFDVFERFFGGQAAVDSVEFWGAMQLAMLGGFVTSYPMNWYLIRAGIKEAM
jgi:hypothetical protein